MLLLLRKIVEWYNHVFYELQDARTRDWSPNGIILLIIMISYYYFCTSLGPRMMKHKKPYELKNVILLYNILQIILSFYIFYEGTSFVFNSNMLCQPIDYSNNPILIQYHNLVWIYYMVKLTDLLDTVFFVLRKKSRQISRLHLYHHLIMPITTFIGLKYYPNGHAIFLGWYNSFVHVIMYSYYLIASLGPKFQKYLWWKRYVTILQLVQFFVIFWQNLIPLLIGCDYPKWINISLCLNSVVFMYMFGKFYYDNYIKKDGIKNVSIVHNLKQK